MNKKHFILSSLSELFLPVFIKRRGQKNVKLIQFTIFDIYTGKMLLVILIQIKKEKKIINILKREFHMLLVKVNIL